MLTPETLVIYLDVTGSEINFLNPAVFDIFILALTPFIFTLGRPAPGFNLTQAIGNYEYAVAR